MTILLPVLRWWFALSVIGWAAVPIAWWIFRTLPDRGLAFARPIGLLLAGYVFWLGVSARVLPNSAAGAVFAVLVVAAFGLWIAGRHRSELGADLATRRWLAVGYEWLFFVVLAGWSLYRAHNPAIETAGGEKYMEMAFISSVLRSPSFPPADPWLSGHAISYYHFGYILIGLLIKLTGVGRFVAFNLVMPGVLAMCLLGMFGLGYNLAGLSGWGKRSRLLAGGATAVFLGVIGSLEGALELAFVRGIGSPAFWQFLDIRNLTVGPNSCGEVGSGYAAGGWLPSRFLWWWRGSRVIHDRCAEVIHEFPFFSFMLADNHPHVLALPFAILVVAVALAVLAGRFDRERSLYRSPTWMIVPLLVGALGFLNAWDLPTYGMLVVVAYALRSQLQPAAMPAVESWDRPLGAMIALGAAALGWRFAGRLLGWVGGAQAAAEPMAGRLLVALLMAVAFAGLVYAVQERARRDNPTAVGVWRIARFAAWLLLWALVLYLPFHIGFRSQASGIGWVAVRSRLAQWLVHFGFLWFLVVGLVALNIGPAWRQKRNLSAPSWLTLGALVPLVGYVVVRGEWVPALLALTLGTAMVTLFELWRERCQSGPLASPASSARSAPAILETGCWPVSPAFALLCAAMGLLLCLGTEFVFIRDLFGSRMNTVFKLFFQAWVLFAIAGGYAVAQAAQRWSAMRLAWALPAALLFAASLVYPLGALHTRTDGWRLSNLTLDGLFWWQSSYPDDLAAAEWLNANVQGTVNILEASGGAYEHNGRISMATGLPTVLGWEGHEHQWRGTREEIDPRRSDVEEAYTTRSRARFEELLAKYQVRFVVVGDVERGKYRLSDADVARLRRWLRPVFESNRTLVLANP